MEHGPPVEDGQQSHVVQNDGETSEIGRRSIVNFGLQSSLPSRLSHRFQDLREDVLPVESSVFEHHLLADQVDVFRPVAGALIHQTRVDEFDGAERSDLIAIENKIKHIQFNLFIDLLFIFMKSLLEID